MGRGCLRFDRVERLDPELPVGSVWPDALGGSLDASAPLLGTADVDDAVRLPRDDPGEVEIEDCVESRLRLRRELYFDRDRGV
jgi:hypothetical protein